MRAASSRTIDRRFDDVGRAEFERQHLLDQIGLPEQIRTKAGPPSWPYRRSSSMPGRR